MKRLLSLILAFAMILALVPVYASAEESLTVEYMTFHNGAAGKNSGYPAGGDPKTDITYTNSKGRAEWLSYTTASASWSKGALSMYAGSAGKYGAYKIRVPKKGVYTVTVQYRRVNSSATAEMYILPISEKSDIANALATAKVQATVDFARNDQAATDEFASEKPFDWEAPVEGEYIVVWKATNAGAMRPANLIFTHKEATGTVPIYADVSATKTELDIATDDTATLSLDNVYMSNGNPATDTSTITFKSLDEAVVEVDGNTVTALSTGKATVAAMYGEYSLGSIDITVKHSAMAGVRAQYPTNQTAYGLASESTTPADIKYAISGKRVDWYYYNGTGYSTVNPGWNGSVARLFTGKGQIAAYKINVPATGHYDVTLQYLTRQGSGIADMYILPGNIKGKEIAGELENYKPVISGVDFYNANNSNVTLSSAEGSFEAKSAGEYIMAWVCTDDTNGASIRPANLILDGCTAGQEQDGLVGEISISDTELVAGKSATVSSSLFNAYTGATASGTVTYSSSDAEVLSVSGTEVTANKAGEATLYAEVSGYPNKVALDVKVEAAYVAPTEINYGIFDNIAASDVVTVIGGEDNKLIGNITAGTKIEATANDTETHIFRYWVLGSEATGRYYSSEPKVTMNPYANVALTAIYTEKSAGKVVDLFNYNGEFLQTLTALSDLVNVKPTMIGHTFADRWLINETTELTADTALTASVTQAVAQYTKNDGYETKNVYEASANGWRRNGKLVTYDEDYTFLTWLNPVGEITENTEAVTDRIPLVALEKNDESGAYMLEYDKGEYEIVEAGILFGESGEPTVESATSKAKVSGRYLSENGHGQFTAVSMTEKETKACGYVMYKDKNDSNKIKVIYSE